MARKSVGSKVLLVDMLAKFRNDNLSRNKVLSHLKMYKEENRNQLSLSDVFNLIKSCIDVYYEHLVGLIEDGPCKNIHSLAVSSVVGSRFSVTNESFESFCIFSNKAMKFLYGYLDVNSVSGKSKDHVENVKDNIGRYSQILDAIRCVRFGEAFCGPPLFIDEFTRLAYLMSTDLYLYAHYVQTDEVTKLIHSAVSARGQKKRWKTTNELNSKAVEIIYKLWEGDDQRLHDKIAKDVVGKMNDKILLPMKKKLLKKYPNKDFDSEVMENYKKELSDLSRGKLANARTVMDMIFQHALDKGRANDPQKGSRKWKKKIKE